MNKTICLQYLEVNSSQKIINKFSKASVICLPTTMVGLGFFFLKLFGCKTGSLTSKSSLAPAPIIQVSKL